nr:ribonuclease H-like domain-containing protein [Tanacetum cinerariifolium]
MNLLNKGCSANPPAQNQPFPGYSSQYASMTPEQFQQHQQEQQQAFFRWQQSQVLNREFQDLQQHPPSFNSETSQSLTQPQQVDSPKKAAVLKFHPKWDAPEQVDLTGDVSGATQEDLFGHDARPRPAGKPRPDKKTKSYATASTGGSSASTQFGELMGQELRLKREAAERAFEAQAEKDRTLMRLEELSHYKARLMANGSTQLEGVDVDETFSPVVKLGTIRTVLSLAVSRHWHVYQLDKKYVVAILERAGMVHRNPCRTHVDTESKLGDTGDIVSDPTLYRSLASSLQYLTFTRPDISYAVQQICLYMHDPREPHFSALKRILRRLTSGYCVFLGNNLLSWSSKCQPTLSHSSVEAEYRGVANAVAETCWIHNLLRELHSSLSFATFLYCDNVSAVYLSCNSVQHQRTKHIEIHIYFVSDLVVAGQVRVLHVPSRYQFADIFTKGLLSALFEEFRSSLSIRCPPAPTAGEC